MRKVNYREAIKKKPNAKKAAKQSAQEDLSSQASGEDRRLEGASNRSGKNDGQPPEPPQAFQLDLFSFNS